MIASPSECGGRDALYAASPVAVRLLSLLRRRGVRATAFAAAQALERNPPVVEELNEGGHEVCAHGCRWAESWTMTEDEEAAAIARAYDGIAALTGTPPVGWYSRWMRGARTRRLLLAHGGFRYDADAYNDDLPYYDGGQLVVPYSLTYNDAHYSYGTFGAPSDFVEYCLRAVDFLTREEESPALVSIGLHPRLSGQAARADAVREIVDALLPRDDVWPATRAEIADYWISARS